MTQIKSYESSFRIFGNMNTYLQSFDEKLSATHVCSKELRGN